MTKNRYYNLLLIIVILGLFYFGTFKWLVESWTHNPYYSHGFLIPIVSGFLIYKMKDQLNNIKIEQSQLGLILLIIGIIFQGIANLYTIRFLSGLSLIIVIFGTVLYLFGKEFLDKIKFPLLFLILMVPIPFIDVIALPIQKISAVSSATLANLIGIPVQRSGLALITSAGSFEVALECSGINSIISLLTVGSIFAFILEGNRLMKFTILISTIPLAIFGNILRITSVLGVAERYGQDTAINYFHDFSSLLLFSIALIGLFLVGRSFGRLKFKKIF